MAALTHMPAVATATVKPDWADWADFAATGHAFFAIALALLGGVVGEAVRKRVS